MTKKLEVVIVTGDDWQGLYVDRALQWEQHSIGAWAALELIAEYNKPFSFEFVGLSAAENSHLENVGNLPAHYADIEGAKWSFK